MGQALVETELNYFDELEVHQCPCELELVPANSNLLRVESVSFNSEKLKPIISNNRLHLLLPPPFSAYRQIKITLFYRTLTDIVLEGQMEVTSSKTISGNSFSMDLGNQVHANLEIDVDVLVTKATNGSVVIISGRARTQTIELYKSEFEGFDLESETSRLNIREGRAKINASQKIEGELKFGSKVIYKGDPAQVTVKVKYGSSLVKAAE